MRVFLGSLSKIISKDNKFFVKIQGTIIYLMLGKLFKNTVLIFQNHIMWREI